jgi:hypothetical protein
LANAVVIAVGMTREDLVRGAQEVATSVRKMGDDIRNRVPRATQEASKGLGGMVVSLQSWRREQMQQGRLANFVARELGAITGASKGASAAVSSLTGVLIEGFSGGIGIGLALEAVKAGIALIRSVAGDSQTALERLRDASKDIFREIDQMNMAAIDRQFASKLEADEGWKTSQAEIQKYAEAMGKAKEKIAGGTRTDFTDWTVVLRDAEKGYAGAAAKAQELVAANHRLRDAAKAANSEMTGGDSRWGRSALEPAPSAGPRGSAPKAQGRWQPTTTFDFIEQAQQSAARSIQDHLQQQTRIHEEEQRKQLKATQERLTAEQEAYRDAWATEQAARRAEQEQIQQTAKEWAGYGRAVVQTMVQVAKEGGNLNEILRAGFNSTLDIVLGSIAKMFEEWLSKQIAAGLAGAAANKAVAVAQITQEIPVAIAGAYASQVGIPIIGPILAAAAAAEAGAFMGSQLALAVGSAAGGWQLPAAGGPFPSVLHQGEIVTHRYDSAALKRLDAMAERGELGGRGGGAAPTLNLTIQTIDPRSFGEWAVANPRVWRDIAAHLARRRV